MKFKRITALLLSAATLTSIPLTPVLRDVCPDASVTVEAATAASRYYKNPTDNITYEIDTQNKEAYVYSYNGSLTELSIPATVKYANADHKIVGIRANAFQKCSALTRVDLSGTSHLRLISQNAFSGSTVQWVRLGGNNLVVQTGAFQNAEHLSTVTSDSSISKLTIEQDAFTGSAINYFYSYAKNLTVKSRAFQYLGNLKAVRIYAATDTAMIETMAFTAASLTTFSVSCRNITIAQNAFYDPNRGYAQSAIKNITFNSNTKIITLYDHALANLSNLRKVTFSNSNANLFMGKGVFAHSKLQTISLPNTTTSIPAECFMGCDKLENFQLNENVQSIEKNAFNGAKLPQYVYISAKTTFIDSTAFTYIKGVKSFSVVSGNPNYKSSNGVLLSKDGTVLLCYPPLKTSPSYTTTASTIPNGAFNENPYLKKLSVKNLSRPYNDTIDFTDLSNLEELTIPSADYKRQTKDILKRYEKLFFTKLHKLNGYEIVEEGSGNGPVFNDKFKSEIEQNFEKYDGFYFMKLYVEKMSEYVVSQVTTPAMSDIRKALKLRKWIIDRVDYDPHCDDNGQKNNVSASIFLHKESDGKYYTVCEGYALGYEALLKAAGVGVYTVGGSSKDGGHAWNLIQIAGNWYHADITWDDANYKDPSLVNRFNHFLCSDEKFDSDGHEEYGISGTGYSDTGYSQEPQGINRAANLARIDNRRLGDVNGDNVVNQADVTKLCTYTGKNVSDDVLALCDLDFDGQITAADSYLLDSYVRNDWVYYSSVRIYALYKLEQL